MSTKSLLGYLAVLNHKPTLDLLSPEELQIGNSNEAMLGCLFASIDFIKADGDADNIIAAIEAREKVNVDPNGNAEELQALTKTAAELVHGFYLIAKLKKGTLTVVGSGHLYGSPDHAGDKVNYDEVVEDGFCFARNVYHKGQRIGGIVSIGESPECDINPI